MNAIERLKLAGELRKARGELATASNAIAKLRIVKVIREVRIKLGLGAAPPDPETTATGNDNVATLREIAAGKRDKAGFDGLQSLYAQIDAAVQALSSDNLLEGEAEEAANAAITHWAELEEKLDV
jgi:hypothetical protein